jgi:hypothetical protein
VTPQAWSARQASLRQYVFDTPTRYVLEATSEQQARDWFSDDAEVESVDCGPMLFGKPRLIAILPMGVEMSTKVDIRSRLQRFAELFRAATRPLSLVTLRTWLARSQSVRSTLLAEAD